MAKKKKEEMDEILEDIESSLAGVETLALSKVVPGGYLITIYPNGIVEIATGGLAKRLSSANSDPCICPCG